jgi:hypothetical protein
MLLLVLLVAVILLSMVVAYRSTPRPRAPYTERRDLDMKR